MLKNQVLCNSLFCIVYHILNFDFKEQKINQFIYTYILYKQIHLKSLKFTFVLQKN